MKQVQNTSEHFVYLQDAHSNFHICENEKGFYHNKKYYQSYDHNLQNQQ